MHASATQLTARDFQRLAALIESHTGIKMPSGKKIMVEGRLRKRVRALGLDGIDDYCRFIFDRNGLESEFIHLIDCVTTNKTDFFREPKHFDLLVSHVVPEMVATRRAGIDRPLALWSAACSSGQEPYTAAMVLADFAAANRGFSFQVYATDISTEVLATAARAIYPMETIEPIPEPMRKRHLLRSRQPAQRKVRIAPELRGKVAFERINLLDGIYPWKRPMDVTFCRNVLIYFDKPTQQRVLDFLCEHLVPGGYLFLGHSETLSGLSLPVRQVAPSVYCRE